MYLYPLHFSGLLNHHQLSNTVHLTQNQNQAPLQIQITFRTSSDSSRQAHHTVAIRPTEKNKNTPSKKGKIRDDKSLFFK